MLRNVLSFVILIISITISKAQTDHKQIALIKSELSKDDISTDEIYVTDHYISKGITHTYYKEAIEGIPIFNSRGAIHYKTKSDISSKSQFVARGKNISSSKPSLTAIGAVTEVARQRGVTTNKESLVIKSAKGREQKQELINEDISLSPIPVKLQYYITDRNEARLVWELSIESVADGSYRDYLLDAESGVILEEISWTVECNHGDGHDHREGSCDASLKQTELNSVSNADMLVPNTYQVYEWPVESPHYGARTVVNSPWDDNLVASPNGWHTVGNTNYTTSRGNNTDAYLDDDNTNSATGGDAARVDGGANLEFIFPLDVTGNPIDFQEAAITNTFYWANLMHDVWYNYGFDEASGNFQEENYTTGGNASDHVLSEAQDGEGTCNANFGTPPDGGNPRMQMFLCNGRDGDYDNAVIAHEYGHGISNRLTGGPAAAGCLNNQEQMGEGWSDFLGIVMTIENGDQNTDARTVGTWLFNQGVNGNGIRPFPYSTDLNVNPMTYASSFQGVSVPHGVGSVWCTMLWDMTWALIGEYGFDSDIYNGTGGNNVAMELVIEGMKLQPCRPGFVDGRDGILEADMLLNGGVNQCLIWEVFAARGLGYTADQGSSASRSDGMEAFDLPPEFSLSIEKSTTATEAIEGDQITFVIDVENNYKDTNLDDLMVSDIIPDELEFVSASDGGSVTGNVITWPNIDLTSGTSKTYDVVLRVKSGLTYIASDFLDDIEGGAGNWTVTQSGSTNWSILSTAASSGTDAWFAPDNATSGLAFLDLAAEVGLGENSSLSFFHQYDTEATWDGGQVFISNDEGANFNDLGDFMIENGYNSTVFNSVPGFSGNSNGFVNTRVDLSSFSGQNVIVRFLMNCDQAVGGNGWWIDDVIVTDVSLIAINQGIVQNTDHERIDFANGIKLNPPASVFQAELIAQDEVCEGQSNGSIEVIALGGTSNYTYLWNDGNTLANRTNIPNGIYTVTITDTGQEIVKTALVNSASAVEVDAVIVDVNNVAGDNGSIALNVSGGTPNYFYAWSNGASTSSLSGVEEGDYSVTVSDMNGCEETLNITIDRITCGDTAHDSGGQNGNYSNFEDIMTTYCPDSPDENLILTFTAFDVEPQFDALYIYNGDSTNKPLFESGNPATLAGYPANGYYGNALPGPFVSTDESGCITLRFRADGGVTELGWSIDVSCEAACSEEVTIRANDGLGSLRRTIFCAEPGAIIPVSTGLNLESISLSEKIIIDKEISLDMPDGNLYSIIVSGLDPIFEVMTTGSLELNNVSLLSSEALNGAAIINNGTIILNVVNISANEDTPNQSSLIMNNGQMVVKGKVNIIKE